MMGGVCFFGNRGRAALIGRINPDPPGKDPDRLGGELGRGRAITAVHYGREDGIGVNPFTW